jgi:AcrR family transcriptional regulator
MRTSITAIDVRSFRVCPALRERKRQVDELTQEPVIVWMRPERGARGPAAGHSRAELGAAAVGLADRDGLAAVSMRQVAKGLGVGQSSLYRYIAGREDLFDLMTDAVAGEIDLDATLTGDPVADLLALAHRTKSVQLQHPWLSDIPPEGLRMGPHGLAYLEHALRALAPAGLPGPARLEVVAVMGALITQFTRTELRSTGASTARRAAQVAYLGAAAAGGSHPHLTAALSERTDTDPPAGADEQFRRVLHRVLSALVSDGS